MGHGFSMWEGLHVTLWNWMLIFKNLCFFVIFLFDCLCMFVGFSLVFHMLVFAFFLCVFAYLCWYGLQKQNQSNLKVHSTPNLETNIIFQTYAIECAMPTSNIWHLLLMKGHAATIKIYIRGWCNNLSSFSWKKNVLRQLHTHFFQHDPITSNWMTMQFTCYFLQFIYVFLKEKKSCYEFGHLCISLGWC
jgi:hypothetical protein